VAWKKPDVRAEVEGRLSSAPLRRRYVRERPDVVSVEVLQDGELVGDFRFVWERHGLVLFPTLEVVDSGWKALFLHCAQLCRILAQFDDQNVSPDKLCHVLGLLGFEDATSRTENG
jgi:hypothetical protein